MYTIKFGNDIFYDPRLDGYPVGDPKLVREANKLGTLTFTVYPTHPAYGNIQTLRSVFAVYKDWKLIYKGRPAYSKRAFKNGMDYKCEEITGAMNDYLYRPEEFSGDVSDLFYLILASFNNRSDGVTFEPGEIQNPGTIEYGPKDGYKGHWDALQTLVKAYGGYIMPRYENELIYLDWRRDEDLPNAQQEILFGANMTDMFIETDVLETFSGVIPIGGVPEGEEDKIDITSVNGGSDVLYNEDAVDLYGHRETMKEWPGITDPAELLEAGLEWVRGSSVKFRQSVKLSAVDLHYIDPSIESLPFMHWVTARSAQHDLFERYILSREEVPLNKPTGMKITLGDTRRTFSESVVIKGGTE